MSNQDNKTNNTNTITVSKEERDAVVDLFKHSLNSLLVSKNKDLVRGVDMSVIVLLFQESGFKKVLTDTILSNEEEVTSQKMLIDGKPKPPTIANWINDFIKNVGVGEADSLKISKFLVHSDNAKSISDDEKNKLGKLLTLYRNLKFFPASMGDVPVDKWEVIPVTDEKELGKARSVGEVRFDITDKDRSEYKKEKEMKKEKEPVIKAPMANNKNKVGNLKKIDKDVDAVKNKLEDNSKKTSNMFNDDENDEIRKLMEKAKSLRVNVNTTVNFEKEAANLLGGADLKIKDDLINTRLKNVVMSSIKGVRSMVDTRDALTRSVESGGVGLAKDIAEIVLVGIKGKKSELVKQSEGKPKVSKTLEAPRKELEKKNVDKSAKKDVTKILMPPPPAIKKEVPSIPPPPIAKKPEIKRDILISDSGSIVNKKDDHPSDVQNIADDKPIKPKIPEPVKHPMGISAGSTSGNIKNSGIKKRKSNKKKKQGFFSRLFGKKKKETKKVVSAKKTNGKIKMQDVKRVVVPQPSSDLHKLIGPIEELEGLAIDDFRDWSDDPSRSIKNVEKKIDNLAKVSLTKKILGIKAWKKSEMYKLYLTILNNAVLNNMSIDDVLRRFNDERKPTMSKAEFNAISQLSDKLRF